MNKLASDIILGQYFPGNSYLHRLDPRVKIILSFILMIVVFIAWSYLSLAVVTLVTILFVLMSQVSFKSYFRNTKFIIIMAMFSMVLNLFYGTGEPIFQLGFVSITESGIQNSIIVAVRIINLLFLSTCLMFTTSPNDMTHGIESMMRPLKRFNINVDDITIMMTIALRFIPITLDEANKIINAQKSRGADMNARGLINKIKSFIPVILPLFASTFKRAYDLSMAMEARCYGLNQERTYLHSFKIGICEIFAVIFVIAVLIGVIICNLLNLQTTF